MLLPVAIVLSTVFTEIAPLQLKRFTTQVVADERLSFEIASPNACGSTSYKISQDRDWRTGDMEIVVNRFFNGDCRESLRHKVYLTPHRNQPSRLSIALPEGVDINNVSLIKLPIKLDAAKTIATSHDKALDFSNHSLGGYIFSKGGQDSHCAWEDSYEVDGHTGAIKHIGERVDC